MASEPTARFGDIGSVRVGEAWVVDRSQGRLAKVTREGWTFESAPFDVCSMGRLPGELCVAGALEIAFLEDGRWRTEALSAGDPVTIEVDADGHASSVGPCFLDGVATSHGELWAIGNAIVHGMESTAEGFRGALFRRRAETGVGLVALLAATTYAQRLGMRKSLAIESRKVVRLPRTAFTAAFLTGACVACGSSVDGRTTADASAIRTLQMPPPSPVLADRELPRLGSARPVVQRQGASRSTPWPFRVCCRPSPWLRAEGAHYDVKCLIEIATGAKFQCRGASPVSARFRRCDDAEFELLIRTTKCP